MGEGCDLSIPNRAYFEDDAKLDDMAENAKNATEFMKALAHEARLMILCYLSSGEKSVTELEELLSLRQPTVSQQLARLRAERIIEARRDGKLIYYSIADPRARAMVEQVYEMFCRPRDEDSAETGRS